MGVVGRLRFCHFERSREVEAQMLIFHQDYLHERCACKLTVLDYARTDNVGSSGSRQLRWQTSN